MRILFFIAALVTTDVIAKQPDITFDSDTRILQVSDKACLYGRGINEALQKQLVEQVRTFAIANQKTLASKWMREYRLKRSQARYIHLLLTSKLDQNSFQYEFSFSGNDTCAQAEAQFNIEEEVDFSTLFSMQAPQVLYLEVEKGTLNKTLKTRLKNMSLPVIEDNFSPFSTLMAEYRRGVKSQQVYEFALAQYLNKVTIDTKSVEVDGSTVFASILRSYLQSKNFRVVSSGQSAYWTIKIDANIEQEKFVNLTLSIVGKNQESLVISNNSRKLPPSNLTNPVLLEKFTKVHFELMQLAQSLEARPK